jgi:hypothetical protein
VPARGSIWTWLGLSALTLGCFLPLALDRPPVAPVTPGPFSQLWSGAVFAVLLLLVGFRAWLDRHEGRWGTLWLALLAAGMVFAHWVLVDRHRAKYSGSTEMYWKLLNHEADAPHQYRLLPYGFTRLLEWLTGDLWLAIVAYRWFFSFWFCWVWVRFVERFTSAQAALLSVLILVPLYPCSVAWYFGQLTDPLHHTLFVLGLLWIVEDAWLPLAAALFLGIFAKETSVLLVPAYLAVWYPRGWRPGFRTAGLLLVAVLAFVAARGLGWRPDFETINGTSGLMIGTNLGWGEPLYIGSAPLYHNYLHPLLFTLPFLPGIWLHGRQQPRSLWALAVVVIPGILGSCLCFSWLYESRNYVPFLPILVALALPPAPGIRDGSTS